MSNEKYYDDVLRLLTEKGELGVNVIARELNVPLSTMQRYLEKQTYFRKTVNRKWDIPDNVDSDLKVNTMTLMVDSVENALKLVNAQLEEIQSSVQNALMPVNTLKRAVNIALAPVADKLSSKATPLDTRLNEINAESITFKRAVNKHKESIPEEYVDLLINMDYVAMILSLGYNYANKLITTEIFEIIVGSSKELSGDTLEIIEKYQVRV